jgi:hypothetical protein
MNFNDCESKSKSLSSQVKEYVERRHGEPNNFLFLPKMGLLGTLAGNEKKSQL